MRTLVATAIVSTLVMGSAQAQNLSSRYDQWAATGQERIRSQLRDPSSARFGRVVVSLYEGSPVVCGIVNSTNGFGGYNGGQRFIWAGSVVSALEEQMAPGEMDSAWRSICRNVVHVARP